ncbi:MAG: DUF6438 domain-containing protein [Bacillota bacterium]
MFKKITLSRGSCYGSCPAYKLEIYSDGKVKYEGDRFVKVTGTKIWYIDDIAIKKLNNLITNYGYFDMLKSENPNSFITDLPTITTSVEMMDGKKRTIKNYHGIDDWPEKLKKFEDEIDEIVNSYDVIGKK